MILTKKLLGISCFIFIILDTLYPQNLLDYTNSLKYADHLFQTQQFKLAANEFERVVFLAPADTLSKLKLIRSYRYSNDFTTARHRIEGFYPGSLNGLSEELSDEYIKILLCENLFQEAGDFLVNNNKLNNTAKEEYQLGIYIMQYRWTDARLFTDRSVDLQNKTERFNDLYDIMMKGLNTRYKNPVLAASLSVFIPGAGKLYTKQWKDAIYSFLFIATTSWLTYKSYVNTGVSPNSVLAGTVALSFYSANIYGSGKSAKRYNQKINQSYRIEAEDILLNDQDR